MNRSVLVALIAGMAFILPSCAGCSRADPGGADGASAMDAGPPVVAEKEPNESAATGLVLEKTTLVEANLGANPQKPDVDWYVLKASLPKTVDFHATCPNGSDIGLEIVDESGSVLASVNSGGVGASERFPNLDTSSRTFVRVVGLKKGMGGAYTVTALFSERMPGYELEPNERKVDASSVALGQAISGSIGHANDVDWFRYELPAEESRQPEQPSDAGQAAPEDGGTLTDARPQHPEAVRRNLEEKRLALRVDISSVEGVALEIQILTEAEAVLFAAKSKESAPLSLRNVGVRETDRVIYVAVRSTKGANPNVSYTLTVAPEDATGSAEFEPNDEVGRTTDLPPNSFREGFISPKGDVDVYRLTTGGPSVAKLQLSGVDKVDLVLSIVQVVEGKSDEVILKANEGGPREPEQLNNVACNVACLIRVEAASKKIEGKWVKDDENSDQPYRLAASVVPDDGTEEKESNNAVVSATPLSPGKAIRGTIYPRKDVDYFALDLRDRAVKTSIRATVTGVLKVDVGLYLHRVEEGKLTLVQTADSAKGERPETVRFAAEPGLYALEVRDTKNREANFQDSYQLTVDEGEE